MSEAEIWDMENAGAASLPPATNLGFVEAIEQRYPESVLETLLKDRTTGRNIIWADDEYEALGEGYRGDDEITVERISGLNSGVIKPRIAKERERQSQRTRNRAEVFTPSWLCNQMNNHLDAEWFGREGVFNVEVETLEKPETSESADEPKAGHSAHAPSEKPGTLESAGKLGLGRDWVSSGGVIEFPKAKGRGWTLYVTSPRLEITCGEAPFICSRYDTVTGEPLPVEARTGFLDRKLRVVSERAKTYRAWMRWALAALKSTYGYEYQGDNLVVARINVLETFVEHARARWGKAPLLDEVKEAALVVSWNLWQMDGLSCTVPTDKAMPIDQQTLPSMGEPEPEMFQLALFDVQDIAPQSDGPEPDDPEPGEPEATIPLCVIYDWDEDTPKTYASLRNERMQPMKKFYAVIGNPPYQEQSRGANANDTPIYHHFYDSAFEIADRVELISPARFLFNAGGTPKSWNAKMLSDEHLKVASYESDASKIFPGTSITGGIAVMYRSKAQQFGAIGTFTSFPELNGIIKKVQAGSHESLETIVTNRGLYKYSDLAFGEEPEEMKKTADRRIAPSAFERMPRLFTPSEPMDGHVYVRIFGNVGNERVYRWFRKDYLKPVANLDKYKVLISKADGAAGQIGKPIPARITGRPTVMEPGVGCTETYITVGATDSRSESEAIATYIRTKFARTMIGVLKVTQNYAKPTWRYVPLQDFTSASDIDWTQSVADIDRQLYAKYGLSPEEIEFIETHVKEMG